MLGFYALAATIDLNNPDDYDNQPVPNYINKDNTPQNNLLSDAGATLGRVMFYDKQFSVDGTVSCGSCHLQAFAFGDTALASRGVNGLTGRHAMRLVNVRFANEQRTFWDERAPSLEAQVTQPIQDHAEMGFSGMQGHPDIDSLIRRMNKIWYYPILFDFAFGDTIITELRMQRALAQFVRSIQSFDSKYDIGRASAPNNNAPFNNFTPDENAGKTLFMTPPQVNLQGVRINGGAGCVGCHGAPEFDIAPNSGNNGVVNAIGGGTDFTNTRAPSLRDVVDANGNPNGPMMHNGEFTSLLQVINHYNAIPNIPGNNNLDNRLRPMGNFQRLDLSQQEKNQLIAFIRTLTGSNIYTDPKWSDPFDQDSLNLIQLVGTAFDEPMDQQPGIMLYPNPATEHISLTVPDQWRNEQMQIYSIQGKMVYQGAFQERLSVSLFPAGTYILMVHGESRKFVKL